MDVVLPPSCHGDRKCPQHIMKRGGKAEAETQEVKTGLEVEVVAMASVVTFQQVFRNEATTRQREDSL